LFLLAACNDQPAFGAGTAQSGSFSTLLLSVIRHNPSDPQPAGAGSAGESQVRWSIMWTVSWGTTQIG
jgi:hypothetical protein